MWRILSIIILLFFMPVGCMVAAHYTEDPGASRSQSRHGSTQQAPSAESDEAVIQVYAARAARWRGAFGVHTWIATKRRDEKHYTRLEVIGYRVYWGGSAVQVRRGTPDGMWFGNYPLLLRDMRGGEQVDELITRLHQAARDYPYDKTYKVWPGPNSNTFTAYLARQVPQLRLELPSNAIGKDYLPGGALLALTPSGTGAQISFQGYAGILAGIEEGIEFNLLGLTAGIDLYPPAIKLPGIGRLGFPEARRLTLPDS
ncbi:hypothetical protein IMCC3135_14440 [Granulosicoccus antarcticus IMCC3135]|uniref:DUF3750 domain-containing protein n=2 Tax=Granulosicoccus TaxID=437504 RepID=A0A2Z2NP05_9GAMM|nr:hypothetical protein IMCC3135_14440 [Granulosicoccus antarcticus IMCC3135]